MSKLDRQLREDRLLRDAARALVEADVQRVKGDLDEKTLGKRVVMRLKDGADELFERAKDNAGVTSGIAALVIGGLGLFLAREPLSELLDDQVAGKEDDTPNGDFL